MAHVSGTCMGYSVSSVHAPRVCCSLTVGSVWGGLRRHVVALGVVMDEFLRAPGWLVFSSLRDGFLFSEKMVPSSRGILTS